MGLVRPLNSKSFGYTLLDVVFTVVMLAVMAKFAMMKLVTPATMTLPAQAQSLADLVRRAQSLAMVRGQRMSVSVPTSGANGRIAIACTTGTTPCATDTSLTVEQGVVVGNLSTPIYFNSLGQPVNISGTAMTTDSTLTLSYVTGSSTATYVVTVVALTGRVSVSP